MIALIKNRHLDWYGGKAIGGAAYGEGIGPIWLSQVMALLLMDSRVLMFYNNIIIIYFLFLIQTS